MRKLYAFSLSPFCRKVRLTLAEKGIEVDLIETRPWDKPADVVRLNPASETPVFVEADGGAVVDSMAICEYLEEVYPQRPLLPEAVFERAETRRLIGWFDGRFRIDVTEKILTEKVLRRLRRSGEPDSRRVREGGAALREHLGHVNWLAEHRNWLAGDALSLADFAAAGHLSVLDYLGEVNWANFPEAATWYARIKSRPAFRALLADRVPGLSPAPHYADLDF